MSSLSHLFINTIRRKRPRHAACKDLRQSAAGVVSAVGAQAASKNGSCTTVPSELMVPPAPESVAQSAVANQPPQPPSATAPLPSPPRLRQARHDPNSGRRIIDPWGIDLLFDDFFAADTDTPMPDTCGTTTQTAAETALLAQQPRSPEPAQSDSNHLRPYMFEDNVPMFVDNVVAADHASGIGSLLSTTDPSRSVVLQTPNGPALVSIAAVLSVSLLPQGSRDTGLNQSSTAGILPGANSSSVSAGAVKKRSWKLSRPRKPPTCKECKGTRCPGRSGRQKCPFYIDREVFLRMPPAENGRPSDDIPGLQVTDAWLH